MSSPSALVLAGGTGGHIYPALAVALELRQRGFSLDWMGTRRGLEARVVPAAGIELHTLPVRGIRGKGLLNTVQAVFLMGVSLIVALVLLLRLRPSVVVGMGGYASVPAALAAKCLGKPLMLQEQNAVAGSANRGLARFAQRIATGFPGVLEEYSQSQYLGNPVRADLLGVDAWTPRPGMPTRVLILGGSLGARPLNEALPAVAAMLSERCEWRHQCGPAHYEQTQAAYKAAGVQAAATAYIDDMASAYAWADLVVARAGALTVAELAATGRPSILVPLPHAIDDHQSANARFLADAGAAVILPQSELGNLGSVIADIAADSKKLASMAHAAAACSKPAATQDIADAIEGML